MIFGALFFGALAGWYIGETIGISPSLPSNRELLGWATAALAAGGLLALSASPGWGAAIAAFGVMSAAALSARAARLDDEVMSYLAERDRGERRRTTEKGGRQA